MYRVSTYPENVGGGDCFKCYLLALLAMLFLPASRMIASHVFFDLEPGLFLSTCSAAVIFLAF